MAQAVKRYYTMPKGPDGRRHREWHEIPLIPEWIVSLWNDLYPNDDELVFRNSPVARCISKARLGGKRLEINL